MPTNHLHTYYIRTMRSVPTSFWARMKLHRKFIRRKQNINRVFFLLLVYFILLSVAGDVYCRRCFGCIFLFFFFLGWVALSTYHTEFNIVYCGVMVRNGCGHNICDRRLYYSLHEYLYVSRKIFCLILAKLLHIVVAHCCSNCTPKNCSVCLFYFIPNFRLLFWAICSTGITP